MIVNVQFLKKQSLVVESNHQPHNYEICALPIELTRPEKIRANIQNPYQLR